MSEKLLEEYDIDFDNIENTIKSLKISRVLVLDDTGNTIFCLSQEGGESRLTQLANALLSLLDDVSPWTMIESNNKKIYIYKRYGKVVILETHLSEEEFENIRPIIDALLDEKIEEKSEVSQ